MVMKIRAKASRVSAHRVGLAALVSARANNLDKMLDDDLDGKIVVRLVSDRLFLAHDLPHALRVDRPDASASQPGHSLIHSLIN